MNQHVKLKKFEPVNVLNYQVDINNSGANSSFVHAPLSSCEVERSFPAIRTS
jgi:hypothetical protein